MVAELGRELGVQVVDRVGLRTESTLGRQSATPEEPHHLEVEPIDQPIQVARHQPPLQAVHPPDDRLVRYDIGRPVYPQSGQRPDILKHVGQ